MIRLFLLIITCLQCLPGYAHNAKEAFFKIENTSQAVLVNAEFPWTIRQALFLYNPDLSEEPNASDIADSFNEYVALNLILKDNNDDTLSLLRITEQDVQDHAHQANYIFEFEYGEVATIYNSLMFNLNGKHRNYHTISGDTDAKPFVTSMDQPAFHIGLPPTSQPAESRRRRIVIASLLFGGILVVLLISKRNSS